MTGLSLIQFDNENRNFFRISEEIYKVPLITVVHMHSKGCIQKVLVLNMLRASIVTKDNHMHSCVGKVILCKYCRDISGYIKSKKGNICTVHLISNEYVKVAHFKINKDLTSYIYPGGCASQYVIVQYIPVIFLFKKNRGVVQYILFWYSTNETRGDIIP